MAARITAQERERCRTLLAETPAQELGPVQRAYARLQADAGASQGSGEDLSPAQRAALDRLVAERQAQMQAQCEAELGQAETGPEASEVHGGGRPIPGARPLFSGHVSKGSLLLTRMSMTASFR